ncbi:MAG: dihydroxyacetone kinase subunit L [Anaerolineales bacterium]|nr:dihydroxyacetone kinase subunit L [Anaerolineales bacterium]
MNIHETIAMMVFMAEGMISSQDLLTQADKAIGDGDHGVGMARGFEAVRELLEQQDFSDLGELLQSIGMTLLTSIGGAAGAIFGTFFIGGSKNLSNKTCFDAHSLAHLLEDGLRDVEYRGKAAPGDKTMVDALHPAAKAARANVSKPLELSLIRTAEAAKDGMENTKEMVATIGKAKSLGERSLGHPDPGALSVSLMLQFMTEYVESLNGSI